MSFEIKYVKKSRLAHEPKMATSGSAGCDLFATEDKVIKPQSTESVCVHLEMEIPPDITFVFFRGQAWHVIISLT